jgi:hypothetical protein
MNQIKLRLGTKWYLIVCFLLTDGAVGKQCNAVEIILMCHIKKARGLWMLKVTGWGGGGGITDGYLCMLALRATVIEFHGVDVCLCTLSVECFVCLFKRTAFEKQPV